MIWLSNINLLDIKCNKIPFPPNKFPCWCNLCVLSQFIYASVTIYLCVCCNLCVLSQFEFVFLIHSIHQFRFLIHSIIHSICFGNYSIQNIIHSRKILVIYSKKIFIFLTNEVSNRATQHRTLLWLSAGHCLNHTQPIQPPSQPHGTNNDSIISVANSTDQTP